MAGGVGGEQVQTLLQPDSVRFLGTTIILPFSLLIRTRMLQGIDNPLKHGRISG